MRSQISLLALVDRTHKAQLGLLLVLSLASSFLDFAQIALIKPFILLIGGTKHDISFTLLSFNLFTISNPSDFIFPLAVSLSFLVVIATLIKIFTIYGLSVFTADVTSYLAQLAYSRSLNLPFAFYALNNSSEFTSLISVQIASAQASIGASLSLLTNALFLSSSIFALFVVTPSLLFAFSSVIFLCYILFGSYFSPLLHSLGIKINTLLPKRQQLLEETYGSIRDIRLSRANDYFVSIFSSLDHSIRRSMALASALGATPRYLVESLGLLLLICVTVFLAVKDQQSFTQILSSLGAFAFGAQKILPNSQQIYSSWATIKVASPEIDRLLSFLSLAEEPAIYFTPAPEFKFHSLVFSDVSFAYPSTTPSTLQTNNRSFSVHSLSFLIQAHAKIGVIGASGSGKSTLIDLILGNLKPNVGRILCNGEDLHSSPSIQASWSSLLSHVPQHIYMADQTILENIAFGNPRDLIDFALVEQAAKLSCLHEFILTLPASYETVVGENAVQLSGGQKQRLGIARALYRRAQFLILDEASSALDSCTEQSLLQNLFDFCSTTTILLVSHKVSTLLRCDYIFELSAGCLSTVHAPDSYDSLLRRSDLLA